MNNDNITATKTFIAVIVWIIVLLMFNFTEEKKEVKKGEKKVQKIELYKDYPYTKYYVIIDGKKYEVNKPAYRNIE